jgi:uncharacterized protein (DUF433 family)
MAKWDRITTNPAIMNGQPCIRGMRLTVRRVIEALAVYPNWQDRKLSITPCRLQDDGLYCQS